MTYQANIGNTMAYLWWAGKRAEYFKLKKFLHCSATGSMKVKPDAYQLYTKYTFGPYPIQGRTNTRRFQTTIGGT